MKRLKIFRCKRCQKEYAYYKSYQKHMKTEHNEEPGFENTVLTLARIIFGRTKK